MTFKISYFSLELFKNTGDFSEILFFDHSALGELEGHANWTPSLLVQGMC